MGEAIDKFFLEQKESLTFDDVLFEPGYSTFQPHEINLETKLTRNISLSSPIVSAAMDTVTDHRLAISMARECQGIGIIHRNMSEEKQAEEVIKVKKADNWIISNPITLPPHAYIEHAKAMMEEKKIAGIPIVENEKLVGILTKRDLDYKELPSMGKVETAMTKDNLVTAHEDVTIEEAKKILYDNRREKLLLVDDKGLLKGMITSRDIKKIEKYPNASRDKSGRLIVGAAIGVDNWEKRAELLVYSGVDVICIDIAHGHSKKVLDVVKQFKKIFPEIDLIAGNVATYLGAKALLDCNVDAIKVGVGPGSICTTRVIAGIGVPQLSAIYNSVKGAGDVPVIADGGIKFSGDIVKALAVGASTVMIGSLLAGTEEAPGEKILYQGRAYKDYRGMGSEEAIKDGMSDRYGHDGGTIISQGVESRVPYKGNVKDNIDQLLGGLKAGMGYLGAKNLKELGKIVSLVKITSAGLHESHPHDVEDIKGSKNYNPS